MRYPYGSIWEYVFPALQSVSIRSKNTITHHWRRFHSTLELLLTRPSGYKLACVVPMDGSKVPHEAWVIWRRK